MNITMNEAIQFVEQNDVKFVKLAFFDVFGKMKNISILASELPRAFETGIGFDASCVRGFMQVNESDLILFPDPGTLTVLPWRPQQGRVVRLYCNIRYPDGTPFEGDGRYILKNALLEAQEHGYTVQIGSECEFYLFNLDENGNPTKIPQDFAGYCDVAPADKAENVRREICLALEEMGIMPESSHHESGPGQNEIDFKYSNALEAADDLQTFKSVVKSIASRNGLYASFIPLPLSNSFGSGLHINFSLLSNGINIFEADKTKHSNAAESFIAGILNRVREMTLFLNPITNSYLRFGRGEAPQYISWSHQNRSQLVRIPAATGEFSRMELRSPDPSCNPYVAFSLLIYAGIEGIRNNSQLPQAVDLNLYQQVNEQTMHLEKLPSSLSEALELAKESDFVKSHLNDKFYKSYLYEKQNECTEYESSDDREVFEDKTYFLDF